jgi:hypothetical protein
MRVHRACIFELADDGLALATHKIVLERAFDMRGEIAIAEIEPRRPPEFLQSLHELPALQLIRKD